MKKRRHVRVASRREVACRRLPQRAQRTRRNKSFREFLRKS